MTRACGDCQLCCKLMPLPELRKGANTRCQHQRRGKGCMIYRRRPQPCALWSCRWLTGMDTHDQQRPDRSHVVIDMIPDSIEIRRDDTGASVAVVEVVQIWVDPDYRDAWRTDAVRAFITRRAAEGVATIVRWGTGDGMVVLAPPMTTEWVEERGTAIPSRTSAEVFRMVQMAREQRGAA
jgi:hypothetical protein